MTDRANFQQSYLWRYLIIGVSCLAFAAWFAYDGFVAYPQKLIYAAAYDELRDVEEPGRSQQWKALVAKNNWPPSTPTQKAEEIHHSISQQYLWGAITLLISIPALIAYLRARGSWVAATENGLTTSWGQTVDFQTVTQLDKKKWKDKGIAKAQYRDADRQRVFVFDDFKFERAPLGAMLRRLEQILPHDKIVGGPPESAKNEKSKPDAETTAPAAETE
jgi:hypothetical protein